MNTLLLVGGDLCLRTAALLDPVEWACTGLRRRAMPATPGSLMRWIQADLGRPDSLALWGPAGRAVAACPAPTHLLYAPAPGARTPDAYAQAYPQGLEALLSALPDLHAVKRCVMVASSAIWGPGADGAWITEDTPPNPGDFRGAPMLAAEALLRQQLPGRGVTLRLSGLYGPGRLRLIDGLRAGRITAPGGPGHWANRIHVDDAARACAHLLTLPSPHSSYIGTDDHPWPTAQLYAALAQLAGGPPPATLPRPADGKRLSNARLRASGWHPVWPDARDGYAALMADTAMPAIPAR